jgi:tetratricopeptide (TPR) repeat protein
MSSSERELWEGIVDREALGEPPSAEERARRDVLARTHADCAAETEVYRALGAAIGKASRQADAGDRLIQTALRVNASESAALLAPAPRSLRARAGFAAGVVSVLAAIAVLLASRAERTVVSPAPADSAAVPPKVASAPSDVERTARLEGVEGSVLVDGATPRGVARVALGSRVQIGTGRACLAFERDVVACAGAGSELVVTALGAQQELELVKGHLVAVLKSQPAGSHFAVSTASGVVRAVGTVFAVEVGPASGTTLRVLEGSVAARMSGVERLVEPGQALVLGAGDASPVRESDLDRDRAVVSAVPSFAPALGERATLSFAPGSRAASRGVKEAARAEPSALALLELASKARSRGAYAEAARHYEQLLRAHASTPEGRAATIGLAELRLSRLGEPARALALFERYLASGGSLSQEAHYGKIQALRALGRAHDAEREVAAFLELYPTSAYAGSLRKSR